MTEPRQKSQPDSQPITVHVSRTSTPRYIWRCFLNISENLMYSLISIHWHSGVCPFAIALASAAVPTGRGPRIQRGRYAPSQQSLITVCLIGMDTSTRSEAVGSNCAFENCPFLTIHFIPVWAYITPSPSSIWWIGKADSSINWFSSYFQPSMYVGAFYSLEKHFILK